MFRAWHKELDIVLFKSINTQDLANPVVHRCPKTKQLVDTRNVINISVDTRNVINISVDTRNVINISNLSIKNSKHLAFLQTLDTRTTSQKQLKQKLISILHGYRIQDTGSGHGVRYTHCIHVSSLKLKLPKDFHTNKVQTAPTHPPPPESATIHSS